MPDREKIIECLQKAKMVIDTWVPMFEQYNTPAGIDDAIALLKEQEERIKKRDESLEKAREEIKWLRRMLKEQPEIVRCMDCKRRGTYDCPVYVGGDGMYSEPDDWFCADGRPKGRQVKLGMSEERIEMLKKALALYEFAVDQRNECDERNAFFCMVEELSQILGTDLHS